MTQGLPQFSETLFEHTALYDLKCQWSEVAGTRLTEPTQITTDQNEGTTPFPHVLKWEEDVKSHADIEYLCQRPWQNRDPRGQFLS